MDPSGGCSILVMFPYLCNRAPFLRVLSFRVSLKTSMPVRCSASARGLTSAFSTLVYQHLRHSPGVYKLVRALLASHNRRYHAPLSTVIPSRQSNILKLTQDCFSEHVRMITCIFSIHLRNFLMYLPLHPAYSLSLASCGLHCVLYMSCTWW